jgi:hypothetical protein
MLLLEAGDGHPIYAEPRWMICSARSICREHSTPIVVHEKIHRVLQANLIVLGVQGASHFAAVTRASIVYAVLAFAHCPVITLSPVVLAQCGGPEDNLRQTECCVAGAS